MRKNFRFSGLPILCALALAASSAPGQVSEFENLRIVDIHFTPSQVLDQSDLAKALKLKKGEPFHAEDAAATIDGLYATGRFSDIVVEAEHSADGVIIRVATQPAWFLGGVVVDGKIASPPNRAQIASTPQLTLGAPVQDGDVAEAVRVIKNLLASNGLYEAEITPETVHDPHAQQIFITFKINEHRRAKYEMPVIRFNAGALDGAPESNSADREVDGSASTSLAVQSSARLPDSTIVHATGWRVPIIHWWRQVTDARTRNGIQGILAHYQKQDRLAARVELDKLDYDAPRRRVIPNLTITPGPRVQVNAVEAKVSRRVLKRYVPIFEEHTVNNDLLAEGKRNLRDYFQSQGYYDASVDVRSLTPGNDLEAYEYVISKGTRYKLAHISFSGNHYFDDDTLRERMYMQPASFGMRHGRFSEAFRRKDEENIANLYHANGFRDVKVTCDVSTSYRGKPDQLAVTVRIDEGAQWFVDHVSLNGVKQADSKELLQTLASIPGQPFSEVNLARDRDQILTYYYVRGFPGANLAVAWKGGDTPHHVDVSYTLMEGNREYVREVITSGIHTTRKRLIDKTITFKPGDPLSPVEQTEIQKRFYDLGIFARVDTAIENPAGDTEHKYLLYNFEEANRYVLGFGVGAQIARFGTPNSSSLASPGGATGFSPEFSFDVSRINFLGVGQSLSLHGLYSTLETRGSFDYLVPRLGDVQGRDLTFTLLYDKALNVRTFASRRQEASLQLSERYSKSITGSFRLSYRRVSVGSVVIPVLLVPQLLQPVRLGVLSASIAQDRRDDKANPHRGIYNTVDIGLAGRFLGGQRSFGRVLLRNATYHSLTRNLVFARQTQFGVIAPFSAPAGLTQEQSVPLPERFFGGGADSLRAFPYNQAGPRDTGMPLVAGGPSSQPTGFPLGGNALFFNNIELRFPLIGSNIQGVFFHDMGNVFSTLGNMSFRFHQKDLQDFDYMVHAAGFGIRYRTPVGPIRLDLAYSINPPSFVGFNGTPDQLLQCGPNAPAQGVCKGVTQNVSHFQFFFSIGQTF